MSESLLNEKYRPKVLDDCILPTNLRKVFTDIVQSGEITNMLFNGGPGMGKTTMARVLCNMLNSDFLLINGSNEGRLIDTLRHTITNYASTISLTGGNKVVIIDEADYLNAQSVQPALRGFIEKYKHCRFILTANNKNRIIEPLHSRCSPVIDFNIPKSEIKDIAMQYLSRLETILEKESIPFKRPVLGEVIKKYFPDFRRVLNEIQSYSSGGTIDEGILSNLSNNNIKALIGFLKEKDFTSMRKWVVDNSYSDMSVLFRGFYDSIFEYVQPRSIPQAVLLISDYAYKSAFVTDQEINMVACLTEIMAEVQFK